MYYPMPLGSQECFVFSQSKDHTVATLIVLLPLQTHKPQPSFGTVGLTTHREATIKDHLSFSDPSERSVSDVHVSSRVVSSLF